MKKETLTEVGATSAGLVSGGMLGSTLGVVGFFGGAPLTIPLALVVGGGCWGYTKYKNLCKENARLKARIA